VQLAYQICTQGRADLALAPDESTGFTMTLLRLLAFEPAEAATAATPGGPAPARATPRAQPPLAERNGAGSTAAAQPTRASAAPLDGLRNIAALRAPARHEAARSEAAGSETTRSGTAGSETTRSGTAGGETTRSEPPSSEPAGSEPARGERARSEPAGSEPAATPPTRAAAPLPAPAAWPAFVAALKLTGMAAQLAAQSELRGVSGNVLTLALPASHKHLADRAYADKLKAALEATVGRKVLLAFEVGDAVDASLAAREKRERVEAKAKGEEAFREEPFVRELIARFDARVKPETVDPLPAAAPSQSQSSTRDTAP